MLSKYRFEKTNAYLASSPALHEAPSARLLIYITAMWLKRHGGEAPRLIDFGGACGESIFLLSQILGDAAYELSTVVETSKMVEESANWSFFKRIRFSSDLDKHLNSSDIVYSSGAIMFLENPYGVLERIARSNAEIVAFSRNYFSEDGAVIPQISMLSHNGPGRHVDGYPDQPIAYPRHSISKGRLVSIFASQGMTKVLDTSSVGDADAGDIVFIRESPFPSPVVVF